MYAFLLAIGLVGIVSTTALGFLRGGHRGRVRHGEPKAAGRHGHAKAGNKLAKANRRSPQPAKTGGDRQLVDQPTSSDTAVSWLSAIPSPIDVFAYATGAGAAGFALQGALDPTQTVFAAIAGALIFNFGIVKPLFSLGTKFVTKESEGIEGLVAHPALATCRFDSHGRGLVQVELDGEFVQILAQLEADETTIAVQKGDELIITSIDATKGSCKVSRDLMGESATQ